MVDEEALLAQFTAQFDQQTDDSDTTQADSNDSDSIPAFDADRFLQGLDAIFARHAASRGRPGQTLPRCKFSVDQERRQSTPQFTAPAAVAPLDTELLRNRLAAAH